MISLTSVVTAKRLVAVDEEDGAVAHAAVGEASLDEHPRLIESLEGKSGDFCVT